MSTESALSRECPSVEVREYQLESDFQGLPIPVRETLAPDSNRVVVYAHGSFDHMDGHFGFYSNLFRNLAERGVASTVQLTTARKDCYYRGDEMGCFEAFMGKTFDQEAGDVRKVIQSTIDRLPELVPDPENAEIVLVGLSLGGSLMTINACDFPDVDKLLLISAGCRTKNGALPVMNTYPSAEVVKGAAARFGGKVMHISPEKDLVVPREFQDELFAAFPEGRKERTVVPKADHVHTWTKFVLEQLMTGFISGEEEV